MFGQVGKPVGVRGVLRFFGGVDKQPQRAALRDGVHVLIATPGRLLDLLEEGCTSLKKVDYVVLDEADRSALFFRNVFFLFF